MSDSYQFPSRIQSFAQPAAFIRACGLAQAARRVTNDELAERVDTSDAWISSRTGIKSRRLVDGESCCDLAATAAAQALAKSGLTPADIGLIIVATITPDTQMPSLACRLQARLGIPNAVAYDLSAACSGFVFALNTANGLLQSGLAENALIVGAEVLSKTLDWSDRGSCVLFGDGAGAVVLSKNEAGSSAGLKTLVWGAQGEDAADLSALHLSLPSGGKDFMRMQGRAVYKFAVQLIPELIERCLNASGVAPDELDWVVAHQANRRILEASALKTGIPFERWFMNLEHYGNSSAASIPMALAEMQEQGLLKSGQKVLLAGFGGGLTYGACLIEW